MEVIEHVHQKVIEHVHQKVGPLSLRKEKMHLISM